MIFLKGTCWLKHVQKSLICASEASSVNLKIFNKKLLSQVDADISQVQLKKATQKHQSFNGKPEDRSPNQRESYKVATNRESVSKWPEDSSVKITKE